MNTLDFSKITLFVLLLVLMTSGTLMAAEPDNFAVKLNITSTESQKQFNATGYGVHGSGVFNAQLVSEYNIGTLRTFGKAIFISHATHFTSELSEVASIRDIGKGMMVEIEGKASRGDYIDATRIHVRALAEVDQRQNRGIVINGVPFVVDEDYQMSDYDMKVALKSYNISPVHKRMQ